MKVMTYFILLLTLLLSSQNQANEMKKASLSNTQLLALLPSDADKSRLQRQRRAVEQNLYWTTNRTIRTLPKVSAN